MTDKNCATCGYYHPTKKACVLLKVPREEDDYCSSHNTNPTVCATCGRYILTTGFLTKGPEGEWVEVCAQCAKVLSTCLACKHKVCEFRDNPDPMPQTVVQQIRQGNAIIQATVENPERVKKFCHECSCWDSEEGGCNRIFNCCGRHNSILNP